MHDLDQARIRVATIDHAATYFGGPLNLGASSAARYTSEGHLSPLCDRYGLGPVWQTVAGLLTVRPELLTLSRQARADIAERRRQHCNDLADRAGRAFDTADYTTAMACLTCGELTDPDHRIGWSGWSQLRALVAAKITKGDLTDVR